MPCDASSLPNKLIKKKKIGEEDIQQSGQPGVANQPSYSVKRQHSAGGSSGDTDEEIHAGFTKVEGNGRSTRSAKKVMTPLETILNGSLETANKRSASK